MTGIEKRCTVWASPISCAIREKFGTQTALARHLGVGKSYISEIVNGVRPLPKRVAQALGIEP